MVLPEREPLDEASFFRDLAGGGAAAAERLRRSGVESAERFALEGRDVGTSALAGLVVPQYLTDKLSTAVRSARPLCDAIAEDLAEGGMTITVPKVTTAAAAGTQTSENGAATTSDPATTAVTVPITTVTADVVLSRQAFDRANADLFIGREMLGAIEAETERIVIAGNSGSGESVGLLNVVGASGVTYTDGSPTALEFLPKFGAALTASTNGLKRGTPDVVVTNPQLWYWLSTVGEAIRPPLDVLEGVDRIGSTAMPANLGAGNNETRLVAFPPAAVYVGLGPVVVQIAPENGPGNLRVRITARRYLAVAAIWPAAIAIMSGTGMAAKAA